MSLKNLYDNISSIYSIANVGDTFSEAQQLAFEDIIQSFPSDAPIHILEMGTGNGFFLKKLRDVFPNAILFGLDISKSMLDKAQSEVNFTAIHSPIEHADQHINTQSIDLIIGHFVSAYSGLDTLLTQARTLLKPQGKISIVTSTLESFQTVQQQFADMKRSWNPIKQITAWFARRGMAKTKVPASFKQMQSLYAQHRFTLQSHHPFRMVFDVKTHEEFVTKSLQGGWTINVIDIPLLPFWLLKWGFGLFTRCFSFPLHDEMCVEVITLSAD